MHEPSYFSFIYNSTLNYTWYTCTYMYIKYIYTCTMYNYYMYMYNSITKLTLRTNYCLQKHFLPILSNAMVAIQRINGVSCTSLQGQFTTISYLERSWWETGLATSDHCWRLNY